MYHMGLPWWLRQWRVCLQHGRPGFDPWEGKIWRGEWPLQYSCLEKSMDRGAWQATIHGVAKSQTQLSDWHFHISYIHVCVCVCVCVCVYIDVLDKVGRKKWCTYLCLSCFCDGRYIKELSGIKMQTTEKDHCNRVTFILNYFKDIL